MFDLLSSSGPGIASLGIPGHIAALLATNRTQLIGADLAISVLVETTKNVRSLPSLGLIDHPVVVRIESAKKAGHRTLDFPSRLLTAWFAFASLRAVAPQIGCTLRQVGLPRGPRLRTVLSDEGPRGKCERQRCGEGLVWIHWFGGVATARRQVGLLFRWRKGEHPRHASVANYCGKWCAFHRERRSIPQVDIGREVARLRGIPREEYD